MFAQVAIKYLCEPIEIVGECLRAECRDFMKEALFEICNRRMSAAPCPNCAYVVT